MKNGLPDQGITRVIEDRKGFIWLGTYSGLCKFDGNRFTVYQNNPTSLNSLRNNRISDLWEDSLGRLWIGHSQGIDVFDPDTESFTFHWPDSSTQSKVLRLRQRKDGKLWICTNNGVFVAETKTFDVKNYASIPSDWWTWDIAETDNGSVVVAAAGRGGYYVDATTGKTTQFVTNFNDPRILRSDSSAGRPVMFGHTVHVDTRGRIWLGTNSGVELYDPIRNTFTGYIGRQILTIAEKSDGKFLLGGGNSGLLEFDPDNNTIDTLTNDIYVGSLLIDKQGSIWATSLNGVNQLYPKFKKFRHYLQFGNIGSIEQDANHNIWLLGAKSGINTLYKFDPSMRLLSPAAEKLFLPTNVIRNLFSDREGNIWIVSVSSVEKIEVKTQAVKHSDYPRTSYWKVPISSFIDSNDTVWTGSWDGINRHSTNGKINKPLKIFPEVDVHSFLEDNSRNVWIGSDNGLGRYNLNTGKLDLFTNVPANSKSLPNNTVYNITMDIDQNIWIGTGGGLCRMIKGTENGIPEFLTWRSPASGLANNDVYCIVDGGDGTVWMSCGNMISHFFPKLNKFLNYDDNDGLPGDNFRGMAFSRGRGLKTFGGHILFGGHGLVVFHPDSLEQNKFVPPVVITRLFIHNNEIPVKGTYADTLHYSSPLEKTISSTQKIELAFDQNDFNFEFAALNYINSEQNKYKYKLEPYQKEWIETTADDRVASYTNIDPGEYTFRVIGSNNDGIWNEQGASITIIIAPPWWQTWWAYSLYALAIATLIIYWRNYEIKRLRLKHQADQLRELDQLKTRFFTNISHEFRTPITLIQGPLKELHDKAVNTEERSTFGIMLRNAQRLSKLINQLLDLSKLEAGKMTLHAGKVELVQFLREIAASYESLAANKNIKFFFYPEVAELMVYIDMEKMEKVVHNLLSNAFKFTKENGEVILYLNAEGRHCHITVKDTGIGIPSDQLGKIFDRFHQVDSSQTKSYEGSGLGMALAKDLVELHHGTIRAESIEGKGTTFTVSLRLGKDHLNTHEIIEGEEQRKSYPSIEETFMPPDDGEVVKSMESTEQPILLIVEDNADMRRYIDKTFSDKYQIIEAVNGKDGLAKAYEVIPDMIISDVMMPEMDGYKFCEQVKSNEKTSHIPVILLTAKADPQSKMAGLETGADDYLSKPFDADEIKLIVRNRIEQRRKIRERFSREITLEPKHISITSFDEKFLKKVMAIIEEHMSDENFSIDELSREAGYSNMHFYRKIKSLAGEPPSQFLRTIRLKRAAELLRAKSDNVTQIAYSVGFASLSYFNKSFKEQFGVTPGQFAEENIKSKV